MSEQRVFISYSTEDRPLVRSALKWLRESDLHLARIDDPASSTAFGDDVRSIITDKMRRADTMVLVWSDHAAKSAWVQYEVGLAEALGVPVRVLLAGESQPKLPESLAQTEVVKLEMAKPEASMATALQSLTAQKQHIEEQIREVRTALAGDKQASRTSGTNGSDKRQPLSAARKRVAGANKRRLADKPDVMSES